MKIQRYTAFFGAIVSVHALCGESIHRVDYTEALKLENAELSSQKEDTLDMDKQLQAEVLAQLLEQLTDQEGQLKKRSHCCTCVCQSKDTFFGDDRPLELCNIELTKIAAKELLVTEGACFDGSVCFSGDIKGLPGWFCWNPVECPEWTELEELPPSCYPQCGEMVLNTFSASQVARVAFSYQTKDGVNALSYLLPITLTVINLILLYDARESDSIIPRTRTAKTIEQWHDDSDNCFLAIELGDGTGFGQYTEESCVCQTRTI